MSLATRLIELLRAQAASLQRIVDAYTAVNDATGTQYATGMVALCQKRPAEADRLLEPLENGPFARDALIGLALTAEDRATAMRPSPSTSGSTRPTPPTSRRSTD